MPNCGRCGYRLNPRSEEPCRSCGFGKDSNFKLAEFTHVTNEEWFCSLSTQEKARLLSNNMIDCDYCSFSKDCSKTRSACEKTVLKWLQAEHKE